MKTALDQKPDHPQYRLGYLTGLMQTGRVAEAHLELAEARQRGLQGDTLEALAIRLQTLSTAIDRKVWMPDLAGDDYSLAL
jgi:hypothetical protein